jgi:hypothetical protein
MQSLSPPDAPADASEALEPLAESLDRATRREPTGRPSPSPPAGRRRRAVALPLMMTLILAINLAGLTYYLLPAAGRVRSPLHPWFRPSGYVGQSVGLLTLALFAFIWLYPLRKRVRWLSRTGSMQRWLDLHIVAGLSVPLLGATHAAWHFKGVIGIGYWAMLVVCLSGIVGKYIYTRIPRSRSGVEMTLEQLGQRRDELVRTISSETGMPEERVRQLLAAEPLGEEGPRMSLGKTLSRMIADDLIRWRTTRRFRRELRQFDHDHSFPREAVRDILRMARREMALTQQARMLEASHKLFRFWHVAHLPFAITALVTVLLHVGVVVYLGTTWFW